jgi:PEP-CTERM motif-containing protein
MPATIRTWGARLQSRRGRSTLMAVGRPVWVLTAQLTHRKGTLMIRQLFSTALCTALLAGLTANTLAASFSSSSRVIPNPDGVYQSTAAVDFTKDYNVLAVVLRVPIGKALPPPIGQPPIIDSFSVATDVLFGDGSSGSEVAHGTIEVFSDSGSQGESILGRYVTEILQLDVIFGTGLGRTDVRLRESPTLTSTGVTTIAPQSDGTFRIDSFFDVFTELSVDGGQSWIPASGPIHLASTPEPSSIVLAALGFAGLAAWCWRRRKR